MVIVTGTGDAFCAGMDLKHYVTEYVGATPQMLADWAKLGLGGLTRGHHRFPKPVIAAVNGWALAGGFELAMAADIRIASDRAKFGSFEARRGFHHGDGGIARLVNFCGVAVAMEMLLTAEPIDAVRAERINLISKVVPHDTLMEEARKTAKFILRNDQPSVRSAKQMVLDMIGRNLDDQLYRECLAAYTLMADNPVCARAPQEILRQERSRPARRQCDAALACTRDDLGRCAAHHGRAVQRADARADPAFDVPRHHRTGGRRRLSRAAPAVHAGRACVPAACRAAPR